MEIQVVLREIGEHRRPESASRRPIERERMGGNLHHHRLHARVHHSPKQVL
jgi:hypothetical protein